MSLKEYFSGQLSLSGTSGDLDLIKELKHFDPVELFEKMEGCLHQPYCDEQIKDLMMLYEREKAGKLGVSQFELERYYQLKRALNITLLSGGGDSQITDTSLITLNRLRVMFPHFCNLDQLRTCGTLRTEERLHGIFQNPEFGGIIPKHRLIYKHQFDLNDPSCSVQGFRRHIVELHLYCLCRVYPWLSRQQHELLFNLRNEKSLLSEQQRIQILENYGIVLPETIAVLTPEMQKALRKMRMEEN